MKKVLVLQLIDMGVFCFCFCFKVNLILSHSENEVLKVFNSDVDKCRIKIEIWNVVLFHF